LTSAPAHRSPRLIPLDQFPRSKARSSQ
jgi:hypothetical protein